MQIQQLRKLVIVRSTVYLSIFACVAVGMLYLSQVDTTTTEKLQWLRNDINALKAKLDGMNQKTLELSEAIKAWEKLPAEQHDLDGLRINAAKDLLDKLQVRYGLSNIKTSFSKPQELTEGYNVENMKVVASTVTISFGALTDEQALQFLATLQENFPGYIQVRSFNLKTDRPITREVVEEVAKGQFPALVTGDIDFQWQDLRYTPSVTPKTPEKG